MAQGRKSIAVVVGRLERPSSQGYEQEAETLIERPKRRVLDARLHWAVCCPLRQSGMGDDVRR